MAIIHVPRPPKNAANSNRPVSSLLQAQMEHLHEAEKRLPQRYHSQIYVNAIRTEGEAAEYIRKVTEAIHLAHEEAAARRAGKGRKRGGAIAIAAVAEDAALQMPGQSSKAPKKTSGKGVRKKS
jgi:hypothetical protein